ncbi:hypothetical protein NEUTE1DRAFT_125869 [Neurospora tetrasperma FGSC 2508]|uniref:Uncharacterized protein n=1 Tax=Neurospora tetrasperma (strain FGSC 2508 / ATCC MYA-4615 / P0657) TaxID=510951 RepID=F8N1U0_NEUT8|nr:uncharacterized protein NEUTE1DRAFT_125869 [Neurospora tetrasperma FGSC 2508]EGO52367.1 hypothetical protein NEUTE1DRAFT_125869 [Neurospora tetrasperma FGSC 2508]
MSSISQFFMYSPRSTSPLPQTESKPRQVWTPEEDRLLAEAVTKGKKSSMDPKTPASGSINWCKVASHLSRRNNKDCRKRWHYNVAHNIRKGTWTREEDQRLREAFDSHGPRWSKVAQVVGSRNGDQCWKRWYDCLDPKIDRSPWTPEEDILLLQIVSQRGRNWTEIVNTHFPNRTSLAAKNRYSILRRRQKSASSSSASSPSSSRSRSSTPNIIRPRTKRATTTTTTTTTTTPTKAIPSPMSMTSKPRYLSPTPPTSSQLTPELGQCFTRSPLSLSDIESTSTQGSGLGFLLPPSALSTGTSSFPTTTTTTTTAAAAADAANFELFSFGNNGYNCSGDMDCAWGSCAADLMVPSAGPMSMSYASTSTSSPSPSPSMSSSFSSSSPSPQSLSLNGIYMPVVNQGLVFNFSNVPATQAQQQQQFEFIVQTPTPIGTGAPVEYASWCDHSRL